MKAMNLKPILTSLLLTVLICGGFWLYTKWDLKRFEESLPKVVAVETLREGTSAEQAELAEDITDTQAPAVSPPPLFEADTGRSEPDMSESSASAVVENISPPVEDPLALFLEFTETDEADGLSSGDSTDVSQDAPYDQEFVAAGFDDYNASLGTNPEYAYQRLDEAFREQYGDDPDVGSLVEYVRLSNEGPVTPDTALAYQEVIRRLVSKVSPPEALESLDTHLDTLIELQQLGFEAGVGITHSVEFVIGE